jgi:sortase A
MRKWIGIICILLGIACILGAIGFFVYNRWEAKTAETVAQDLLRDVQTILDKPQPPLPEDREELPGEMPTAEVDGYDCIGILSIPGLDLELPVLTDWSYAKLKKAPCRYYGTYYESDFVIAAHNYESHFGRLPDLQAGDAVIFTDVNGEVHCYEVVLLETLPPTATEEMITSGFDLSLYTCTPGGASRVTVRCTAVN